VFPGAQHLNWMDKITSHVIQMDSNSRSLNSRVSDARASDSEVSDSMFSEVLDIGLGHLESRSFVLEARGLRWGLCGLRPETFSGFDMSGL
jgi:hypothetical protein